MNFSVSTIPISQVGWPNSIIWCIQIGNIEIYRGVRFVYGFVIYCGISSVPARTCSFWRTSEISWSLEPRARNKQPVKSWNYKMTSWSQTPTINWQDHDHDSTSFNHQVSWIWDFQVFTPDLTCLPEVWCQWWWCDLFPGDEGGFYVTFPHDFWSWDTWWCDVCLFSKKQLLDGRSWISDDFCVYVHDSTWDISTLRQLGGKH